MSDEICVMLDDQIGSFDPDGRPSSTQYDFLNIIVEKPAQFMFFDAWSNTDDAYSEWSAVNFLSGITAEVRFILIDMVFGAHPLMGLRIVDLMNRFGVLPGPPRIVMTSQRRERRIVWKQREQALGTAITANDAYYLSKYCLSDGRKFWTAIGRIERRHRQKLPETEPSSSTSSRKGER